MGKIKSSKNSLAVISLFSLILFLSGCMTMGPSSGSAGSASGGQQTILQGIKVLKFEDVPAPAGFRLVDKESFTFQNDRMRVGLLKYTGMANASRVIEFYKEQMPLSNWDLINIIDYEQKIMNFKREYEDCVITIQPTSTRTIIAIAITPRASSTMTEDKLQKFKEIKMGYPNAK